MGMLSGRGARTLAVCFAATAVLFGRFNAWEFLSNFGHAAGVVLKVALAVDFEAFTANHQAFFAEAERSGNYSPAVINYYSVQAETLQIAVGHYWHFVPEQKHLSVHENFEAFNKMLSEELNLSPGKTLCEIGCGLCRTGRSVAAYGGADFIGLTMSPAEVEAGRIELAKSGVTNAKILQGDYKQMPMAAGECDALLAVYTLKYTHPEGPDFDRVFGEVARVLKSGSRFASYEILTSDTFDPQNETHASWVYNISYHTAMPPLSSVKLFRERPQKHGFKLRVERDLQNSETVRTEESYPIGTFYPLINPLAKLMEWMEWAKLKRGLSTYVENFVRHPLGDIAESLAEGIVSGSTLFVYERA